MSEQLTIRLQQNCFQVRVIPRILYESCTKTETVSQILTGWNAIPREQSSLTIVHSPSTNKPVYIGLH